MKDPIVQEFNGKLWISAEHHVHAVEYAIEIVAAAEREACAKIAESYEPECDTCPSGVANAIRARGKP